MPDSGDYYINGTDPGLVFPPERPPDKYVPPGQPTVYLTNPHNASVTLMVVARGYTASDPVPGSCHKLPYKPSVAVRHRHQRQLVAGQALQLVQSVQRAARVPLPGLPPLPAGARPQGRAVLPRHEAVSRHRADPPARQPRHQAVPAQPRRLRLVSGHRQPLCRCCFPRKRHLGLRDVTHGNYYLPYYSTGRCYKKKYTLFWPFEIWQQEVLMNYSLLPKLRSIRLVVSEYEVPKVLVSEECIFFSWEPDL